MELWDLATANIPELPAGFDGSAQIAWPWPWQTGWSEGFPLVAVGRDRTAERAPAKPVTALSRGC